MAICQIENKYQLARDCRLVDIGKIKPSPENQDIYRSASKTRIDALKSSIQETGLLEPIIITKDGFIVSGHTRYRAVVDLGQSQIKARRLKGKRQDFDDTEFEKLLAHYNNQRDKTDAEKVSEGLVLTNLYRPYLHYVREVNQSYKSLEKVRYRKEMNRSKISSQKSSMVAAIKRVLTKLNKYGPTTNRAIHYQLLNESPWFNDQKKDTRYQNTQKHYHNLNNLLTRMRLDGEIPWSAIGDATRTTAIYTGFLDVAEFVAGRKKTLFAGYHRDLLQDQLDHIEIIVEKNTVFSYVEPVAQEYKLPLTVAKGQSSIDCRFQICKRFKESGKNRLICLILSDFDSDGEVIAGTFQNSLEGEFGLPVECYKVGVNESQIDSLDLRDNGIEAKTTSSNYQWFVEQYGPDQKSYELEAMEPETIQEILVEAVTTTLDMDLFEEEKKRGEDDRHRLKELQDLTAEFIAEQTKLIF